MLGLKLNHISKSGHWRHGHVWVSIVAAAAMVLKYWVMISKRSDSYCLTPFAQYEYVWGIENFSLIKNNPVHPPFLNRRPRSDSWMIRMFRGTIWHRSLRVLHLMCLTWISLQLDLLRAVPMVMWYTHVFKFTWLCWLMCDLNVYKI